MSERVDAKCVGLSMEEDLKVRGLPKGPIEWGLIKVC